MSLFAVVRTRGAAWREGSALEAQPQWDEHARFMNGLQAQGVVLLGGPLEGTPDVLLVVSANSPNEIMSAFEDDPWTSLGLLRVKGDLALDDSAGELAGAAVMEEGKADSSATLRNHNGGRSGRRDRHSAPCGKGKSRFPLGSKY